MATSDTPDRRDREWAWITMHYALPQYTPFPKSHEEWIMDYGDHDDHKYDCNHPVSAPRRQWHQLRGEKSKYSRWDDNRRLPTSDTRYRLVTSPTATRWILTCTLSSSLVELSRCAHAWKQFFTATKGYPGGQASKVFLAKQ